MSVTAAIALLSEVVANLPSAISTGQQVIQLVNEGYKQLSDAVGDREVSPEEINNLVGKIVSNSADIQAIGST